MQHAKHDARPTSSGKSASSEKNTGHGRIFAALDLGTNNCRLLIASPAEAGATSLRVHDSYSKIVRLGEGVGAGGDLSEEAMERTIAALKVCQKKLSRFNIDAARFVATEACRRATNGSQFMQRIQNETGLAIDIITAEEEAHLAFMGCSSLLAQDREHALVFDIGGGSTELMWVDRVNDNRIIDWFSINYGVMNLSDKYGGGGLADLAYNDMVKLMNERLEAFQDKNEIVETMATGKAQMLSTSGTVTTVAAVYLDLPRYDRAKIDGITLPVSGLRDTAKRLVAMRPSERFNHPCIGPERSDFIISGCAIFEALSGLWQDGEITIADRGVREGIILSLMGKRP
jgi:exopolyphosphatase/guanosine-5'-triphosphate,3'-diphosphate pyrophosphatase